MAKRFNNFVRVLTLVMYFFFVVTATPMMMRGEIDVPFTLLVMGIYGLITLIYHYIMMD